MASIATRGIQGAHQEGLKIGKGFLKRVFSEFTKKGNAINLGASVLGAGLGFGVKEYMEHMNGVGEELGVTAADNVMGNVENAEMNVDADTLVNDTEINAEMGAIPSQTSTEQVVTTPNPTPTEEITPTEPTLSYAEQCLKNDPDVKADENGWLFKENAKGQPVYIKDASGKMVGLPGAKRRELFDYETLDEAGNIVNKVNEVTEPEMTATFEKSTLEDFKNERHAERFEEMQERDDRIIARYNAKVNEMISKVDNDYIREQMLANETKVMQDFENWLNDKYNQIATDGKVTPRELTDLSSQVKEFLREREQNLRDIIKQNGYDTQPEKDVNSIISGSEMKGVDDPTVLPTTNEVEQSVETENGPEMTANFGNSQTELEVGQEVANERNFNLLSENQQKELIELKARAIVAYEQGDSETYQACHNEFDSRFKGYVAEYQSQNSFTNLGYQQQDDGTWLLKPNKITTQVVTDENENGILDPGDTYENTTEIGSPGGRFYSKDVSSGTIAGKQTNSQAELAAMIERIRAEKNIQQDQGFEM